MKNRKNNAPEEFASPSPGMGGLGDLDAMLEDLKAGRIGINREEEPEEDAQTASDDGTDRASYGGTDRTSDSGADRTSVGTEHTSSGDTDHVSSGGTDHTSGGGTDHVSGGGAEHTSGKSRKKEPTNWKSELISWIQVLITAAIIAFCINTFIIANSQVPTGSMETTIMPGDRVIGSRLHYRFGDPQRGDIAIFVYPDDEAEGIKTYYVKRVIGLPGDSVDIVDGKVYLNGSDTPLDEPYIREPMMDEPPMHFEVPEDSYFMLGDNRNHSNDSRRWIHKYVKREKMIAKVLFQYFPKIQKLK